jgi:anti-sigma factor RsiW
VAKKLTEAEIHRLARLGAAAKLAQLEREIAALKRAFPGLKPQSVPVPSLPADGAARVPQGPSTPHHSRRSPMSAAERQVVSERMKRYWDARRKAGTK